MTKGSRRERELVNMFYDAGYAPMRAPASGAATERELPDVLVGNAIKIYAVEAKSSSGQPIYVEQQEVIDLIYFGLTFGAVSRIAARFDNEDWYFIHPSLLHITDSHSYRVKKEEAKELGEKFEDIV